LSTRLYRSDEGAPRPAPADGAMPADALICGACRASSAIRWHPVDMRPGFGVPVMFPSNDSLTRHPRPSAGFRGRVSRLLRYHEVIRLPTALPARLRVLRLTGTDPRACLCSHAARRPPLGLELWVGQLPCPHFSDRKRPDLPGSWGTLLCLCPALRPRQDHCPQALTGQRHGPR
jgi:hypothetical protein